MTMFYYRLVKAGKLTLDQVPEKWRSAVADMLGE